MSPEDDGWISPCGMPCSHPRSSRDRARRHLTSPTSPRPVPNPVIVVSREALKRAVFGLGGGSRSLRGSLSGAPWRTVFHSSAGAVRLPTTGTAWRSAENVLSIDKAETPLTYWSCGGRSTRSSLARHHQSHQLRPRLGLRAALTPEARNPRADPTQRRRRGPDLLGSCLLGLSHRADIQLFCAKDSSCLEYGHTPGQAGSTSFLQDVRPYPQLPTASLVGQAPVVGRIGFRCLM